MVDPSSHWRRLRQMPRAPCFGLNEWPLSKALWRGILEDAQGLSGIAINFIDELLECHQERVSRLCQH